MKYGSKEGQNTEEDKYTTFTFNTNYMADCR